MAEENPRLSVPALLKQLRLVKLEVAALSGCAGEAGVKQSCAVITQQVRSAKICGQSRAWEGVRCAPERRCLMADWHCRENRWGRCQTIPSCGAVVLTVVLCFAA